MEIAQAEQDGVVVLELKGRLDTLSSSELEKKLSDLIAQKEHKFVLDFSQLDFISSSGLRVLLAAGKQLKSVSGKMVLCALKEHVKEVFDVAGFTMLFSIFPSKEIALKELS
jgi:anti-sigma B factor antagonist